METEIMEKTRKITRTSVRTCPHCGHAGEDVITTLEYVGGQGYVPQTHCADEVACWARWDKANGFENTPAIREMRVREVKDAEASQLAKTGKVQVRLVEI